MMAMNSTVGETALSDATLAQYAADGYIAIPSLIGATEVEAAREALTSVMLSMLAAVKAGTAEFKPPVAGGTGNYDGAWIKLPEKKTSLLFEHSFDPLAVEPSDAIARVRNLYYYDTEHPLFMQLVESPGIKGIAQQLLGEDGALFQSMALVKPALIGSEKPWHQDNAYFKYAPLDKVV